MNSVELSGKSLNNHYCIVIVVKIKGPENNDVRLFLETRHMHSKLTVNETEILLCMLLPA